MIHFKEFVDKKGRWAKKQLHVLKKVLDKQQVKCEDHTSEEDPYLFIDMECAKMTVTGVVL